MATLSQMKSKIQGVSRLNRFKVTLPTPVGILDEVYIKAAGLPGRTVNVTELKTKGATLKIGADPLYNDWTITVYAENYDTYKTFFKWMDLVAQFKTNSRGLPTDYKIDGVKVEQLGLDNSVVVTATLDGIWPNNLADISFDNEGDGIVTFDVTLSLDSISISA